MNKKQQVLIANYLEAKGNLDKWKAKENEYRIELLDEIFPAAGEGTMNEVIGDFKIKGTFRNNYKLDQKTLTKVMEKFSEEEFACISYTPKLSLTAYRDLEIKQRRNLDKAITVAPGMPALAITRVES
jgi:hypothetical protein